MDETPSPRETAGYRSLAWEDLDKTRFFLINPCVFFFLRLIQHPANVVKTRYQVQQRHALYASTWGTATQTLRHEGIRGLYRGFGTSSIMLVVQQAYIVMYEYLRSKERYSPALRLTEPTRNGIAAAVSVFAVQLLANPVDVVTQRLMVQGQFVSNSAMQSPAPPSSTAAIGPVAIGSGAVTSAVPPAQATGAASSGAAATVGVRSAVAASSLTGLGGGAMLLRKPQAPAPLPLPRMMTGREIFLHVLRSRGAHGFYSGFFVSCAQFIPSASLWWWSYPQYRAALLAARTRFESPSSGGPGGAEGGVGTVSSSSDAFARLAEILSGSFASATVAVALNPIDIVRTRTQVQGGPALAVARALVASEGMRGLWKGTSARMAMLIPQGALSVWAYEFVKRHSAREPPHPP